MKTEIINLTPIHHNSGFYRYNIPINRRLLNIEVLEDDNRQPINITTSDQNIHDDASKIMIECHGGQGGNGGFGSREAGISGSDGGIIAAYLDYKKHPNASRLIRVVVGARGGSGNSTRQSDTHPDTTWIGRGGGGGGGTGVLLGGHYIVRARGGNGGPGGRLSTSWNSSATRASRGGAGGQGYGNGSSGAGINSGTRPLTSWGRRAGGSGGGSTSILNGEILEQAPTPSYNESGARYHVLSYFNYSFIIINGIYYILNENNKLVSTDIGENSSQEEIRSIGMKDIPSLEKLHSIEVDNVSFLEESQSDDPNLIVFSVDDNDEYNIETAPYLNMIKSSNKNLTFKDNEFIEVPDNSQQSFEEHGMVELSPLITPTNKAVKTMDFDRVEGDGKIYRKTIDVNKYKRIDSIKII